MAAFPFILVAGNIGAGKSTVVQALAATFSLEPHYEDVTRNPYFADFYTDPTRWAFDSQRAFMQAAIEAHEAITRHRRPAIQDRGVHEMLDVFAARHHAIGNISDEQFESLQRLVKEAEPALAAPSLLLYVQAPLEELARRIRARGRAEESAVSLKYLAELDALYEPFLRGWRRSPVLRLDTTRVDPRGGQGRHRLETLVEQAMAPVFSAP
jgi:deoxyadenosine/deoxycytidine kinase